MDAEAAPERRPGGTVEPVKRSTVAKEFFQVPEDKPAKTYELRDPFAEVTYRAADRASIEAKANELGATRFHERDDSGQRTAITKVNGQWQHEDRSERAAQVGRPGEARIDGSERTQHSTGAMPGPRSDARTGAEKVVPLSAATATATRTADSRKTQDRIASEAPRPALSAPEGPSPDLLRRIEAEATRAARIEQMESALHERYVIKRPPLAVRTVGLGQTEYRFRGDTSRVAFTESMLKLSTDTNNPSVARSMVDVAETRKWGALRVSGNDEFKRLVWLEASVRGIKTVGYEPHRADMELLNKELESRRRNRIEPAPAMGGNERGSDKAVNAAPANAQTASTSAGAATKQSARGGDGRKGGRKAVLAALEAVLVDRNVPEKRREAVMAAAAEQLAQRTKAGEVHRIKILDKDAPSQRIAPPMQPKVSRQRERAGPVR